MKSWSKRLGVAVVGIVVVIGALFFVVTSDGFLRKQVLTRVGDHLGVPITAERVTLRPLRELQIRGLRVGEGSDALLAVGELRLRYQLLALLSGHVIVDEFYLDRTNVNVRQNRAGQLNLPPKLMTSETTSMPSDDAAASETSNVPNIELRNLNIANLTVSFTQERDTAPLKVVVYDLSATLDELVAERPFTLSIGAKMTVSDGRSVDISAPMTATLSGELLANLMPKTLSVDGNCQLSGHAGPTDLSERSFDVALTLRPNGNEYNLERGRIEHRHRDVTEAFADITGQIIAQPLSATMQVTAGMETSRLLNTVGAIVGDVEFGDTTAEYSGKITLNDDGRVVDSSGTATVRRFSCQSQSLGLPEVDPIDVVMSHAISFATDTATLSVHKGLINIDLGDSQQAQVTVAEPVAFMLGASADTAIPVSIITSNLDLSLVRPFVPDDTLTSLSGSGRVNVTCTLMYPSLQVAATGELLGQDIVIGLPDFTEPFPAFSPEFKFGVRYDKNGHVQVDEAMLVVTESTTPLLGLSISGIVVPPFTTPGTELTIRATELIDAHRLEMLMPPPNTASVEPATSDAQAPEDGAPANLHATINCDIAQVRYKDIDVTAIRGHIVVDGPTITVEPLTLKTNDGDVKVSAAVSMPHDESPMSVRSDITCSGIPFQPFISTFVPDYAALLDGQLSSLSLRVNGQGADAVALMDAVTASVQAQVDSMAIRKSGRYSDLLLDALLIKGFGVNWANLVFSNGVLQATYAENTVDIANLDLWSEAFRFATKGTLGVGGEWTPALTVVGSKVTQAEGNAATTYEPLGTIHLTSWDYKKLALRNAPEILTRTGVIDDKDAAKVKAGLAVGKAIGGLFKKKTDDASGEPPAEAPKAKRGFGSLINSTLDAFSE